MPELTGMAYDEARDALSYYGIYLMTRSPVSDPAEQQVSGQSIPAGTALRHGDIVEVTLVDRDESWLGKY